MGDSEFGDPNRSRKYHEGWVQHQPGDGKVQTFILGLNFLCLFSCFYKFHNQALSTSFTI